MILIILQIHILKLHERILLIILILKKLIIKLMMIIIKIR